MNIMDDQVKDTILEVAFKLFQRFGYQKTTVEEIAREAKIGKGTVYLHFKSKEEILLTIIQNFHQSMIAEWIKIVHKNGPADKKISTMLKFNIAEIQSKREEMSISTLPPPCAAVGNQNSRIEQGPAADPFDHSAGASFSTGKSSQ